MSYPSPGGSQEPPLFSATLTPADVLRLERIMRRVTPEHINAAVRLLRSRGQYEAISAGMAFEAAARDVREMEDDARREARMRIVEEERNEAV